MDYNEKVEYLKSYRDKCDRLKIVRNQIEGLQAIKYTPSINGHKKSLSAYMDEYALLSSELEEIEECINSVTDLRARSVLGYKYLRYLTFEEIAEKIGYSKSTVRDAHRNGINQLKI